MSLDNTKTNKKLDCEPFTWKAYSFYLDTALTSGYRFVGYDGITEKVCSPDDPFIILRHDIDYDPCWVLPVSNLESERSIKATYFFQTDSPFYNFDSRETVSVVQAVLKQGHWMGLHFDANRFQDDGMAIDMIDQICVTLEKRFDCSVAAVSFHMPTYRPVGHLILPKNRINTCSSVFSKTIEYISDSNMNWRQKDIYRILRARRYQHIQVLTHPFWWREQYQPLHTKIEELARKTGLSVDDILTPEQMALLGMSR